MFVTHAHIDEHIHTCTNTRTQIDIQINAVLVLIFGVSSAVSVRVPRMRCISLRVYIFESVLVYHVCVCVHTAYVQGYKNAELCCEANKHTHTEYSNNFWCAHSPIPEKRGIYTTHCVDKLIGQHIVEQREKDLPSLHA